ncbi:16S rRNA (adenine(1518)-N(6)/adenine(1519)-N(6))-dimethyltransferase RsmA [Alienimonas chondri]|uniref:Ribosomal RNA small subunit methyltransferase A n=1 Tax=Alienimonas chondri TaxID=2681879 RepID=A0ABX1VC29_9PLAN|nr:16S rRNA (adenine(1518)-N(6)/adenine(1519)-N(6))-dimethyltransferase RsmA [Alienimonas chondri]NNJ25432.1 Ribosomal RNA small subunit methyltransferase A [Alienimonas chondri]
MSLFKRHGLHPRTDLGQNFLIDLNILDFVVREAHLEKDRDVVLEVGAGTAGMTAFLADGAAAVVSVEVDKTMHRMATEQLAGRENVTLLQTDALKNKNNISPIVLDAVRAELDTLAARNPEEPPRLKLVANLPYNIATPIISNLAGSDLPWSRMVAMIQYELAQRMAARPGEAGDGGGGGGSYGALSAWVQNLAGVKILKKIPPSVFWPRPGVDSAVIRLNPNPRAREQIADLRFFQDFLRRLFHHRRKLMRGVLCGMYRQQLDKPEVDALLAAEGYEPNARAEAFDPTQLRELGNAFYHAIEAKQAAPVPSPAAAEEE